MSQNVSFSLLKSVKPTLVPVVWFDDEARITPEIHSQLTLLLVSLNVAHYLKYILPALGTLFIVITSSYIVVQVRHNEKDLFSPFDRFVFSFV